MGCSECCKEEFHPRNFGFGHTTPELTVTSQWDRLPLVVYLIWRWLAAVYHIAWIIVSVAAAKIYIAGKATWWAYLTNWCYFLLTLDLLVEAVAVTIWFVHQRNPNNSSPRQTAWYMKLAWLSYSTATATALMVGLVFWIVIFIRPGDDFDIDFQTHGITIVYVVINIMLTGIPVRVYHLIYPIIFGIIYTIFTVIYFYAGGVDKSGNVYVYKGILDWRDVSTSISWIAILLFGGLPAIHIIIVYGAYMLRVLIYNKCCQRKNETTDESEMSKLDQRDVKSYDTA